METPTVAVLPKVSELIKTSWTSYKKNWKDFFVLGALPFSITLVGTILTLITAFTHAPGFIKGILLVIGFLLSIAGIVVSVVFPLVLIKNIKNTEEGVPFDAKKVYKDMFRLFFPLLWISILFALICMGGSILLIIPGIALSGYLGYYQYVLVTDGTRGLKALISSFYYVRGNWWGVFGRLLALGLIMAVIILPVVAIIGVVFVLLNGGFSADNLRTLFETTQISGSVYALQVLFNLISSAIGLAVVYPIFTFYSYFIFKGLKAVKTLPDEQGQKKARGWFVGLSIVGAVIIPLVLISVITLSLLGARNKASKAVIQQGGSAMMDTSNSLFKEASGAPVTTNELVLESKPYSSKFLYFSIRAPKGWVVTEEDEYALVNPALGSLVEASLWIKSVNLSLNALQMSYDAISEELANEVVATNANMKDVQLVKVSINGKEINSIKGSQKDYMGRDVTNEYFFFIDELKAYIVEMRYVNKDVTSRPLLEASLSTFVPTI